MQDGARQGDAGLAATAGLGQELVDVGGNGLVKVVLVVVEFESDAVRVPVGE